jgi:hypothetical protein
LQQNIFSNNKVSFTFDILHLLPVSHFHGEEVVDMVASARREAIVRILYTRGKCTMVDLARELGVSRRTIKTDIDTLTSDYRYPMEILRGNGGGIRFIEGFSPYRGLLFSEQRGTLQAAIAAVGPNHAAILKTILDNF